MNSTASKVSILEITKLICIGFILVFFLLGLGFYAIYRGPQHETKVEENIVLWQEMKPDSYVYQVDLHCFCFGILPYKILVKDSSEIAVPLDDQEQEYYEQFKLPNEPATIDALFGIIREYSSTAARIDVEYDKTYGYPRKISVDPNYDTYDDEFSYSVTNFTAQ